MKGIDKFVKKYKNFLNWYNFVLYFLIFRFATDISYGLIYTFMIALVVLKIELEKIALIFFSLAVIAYLLGRNVEANHYFSFVYAFVVLIFLKNLILLFRNNN